MKRWRWTTIAAARTTSPRRAFGWTIIAFGVPPSTYESHPAMMPRKQAARVRSIRWRWDCCFSERARSALALDPDLGVSTVVSVMTPVNLFFRRRGICILVFNGDRTGDERRGPAGRGRGPSAGHAALDRQGLPV